MRIRKGDNVIMLSGKNRGKSGKVLSVFPKSDKVIVEGLNMIKKHQRAKKQGQVGQIIHKERAVHVSIIQLICPKCGASTRTGHLIQGNNKARICKKCKAEI